MTDLTNSGLKTDFKIQPVRVVMNTQTLAIYNSTDYQSQNIVFDITKSEFHHSKKKRECFEINENSSKVTLCPFGGSKDLDIGEQWDADFNLFKHKCASKREVIELTQYENDAVNNEMKDKIVNL